MFKGQALQDKFVLAMRDNKREGWFLDLGSQHPIENNNTYILESNYNWRGIMVEYDNSWLDSYKTHRRNSLHVIGDARTIDYSSLFYSNKMPKSMDYLQIDLDVDNAFELAQIQRQLSKWHIHWLSTWANDSSRLEISTLSQTWANRISQMAGVLV